MSPKLTLPGKSVQSQNLVMQADTDLHVSPLPLLPFGCLLGIAQPFSGGPFKGVKVSLVAGQLAAVQMQDVGAHHIEEIPSMRYHHERLGPFAQVVLQQGVALSCMRATTIVTTSIGLLSPRRQG